MSVKYLKERSERIAAELDARSVHLWQGHPSSALEPEILSEDEKLRASRYQFLEDRTAFMASRSATRALLSGYLDCSCRDIRFAYGPHGKPMIAWPSTQLSFNLSHSGGRMLIAVARRVALGVDIEAYETGCRFANAIRTGMTPSEVEAIEGAPEGSREKLLLRYWTQKEASLKAIGVGLSFPLTSLHVSFDEARRTTIRARGSYGDILFHGEDIECGASHAGAIVVDPCLVRFHFHF